jgi:hypothetical protein
MIGVDPKKAAVNVPATTRRTDEERKEKGKGISVDADI